MIFPTVTETTPRPEAVTPDPFIAGDLADRTAVIDVRPPKARLLGGTRLAR
jgi:hypothetical protein